MGSEPREDVRVASCIGKVVWRLYSRSKVKPWDGKSGKVEGKGASRQDTQ